MDCTAAAYAMWSALRTGRKQQCWDVAALHCKWYQECNIHKGINSLDAWLKSSIIKVWNTFLVSVNCPSWWCIKPISWLIASMTFMLRLCGATSWWTGSLTRVWPIIRCVKPLYPLSSVQISRWLMSRPASHWLYCLHHSTVIKWLCSKGMSASFSTILVKMPWPFRCRVTVIDKEVGTPENR